MSRHIIAIIMLLNTHLAWASDDNNRLTNERMRQPGQVVNNEDQRVELIPLPKSKLFAPLRADPKEPRFFVSALKVGSSIQNTTIAAVGFGEHFGIVGYQSNPHHGWQFGLAGAVFSQFDLEAPSADLMNADYVIGLPVTWRRDKWSGRLRVYHQSSHLGDEFLLRVQPHRVNLSFESVEVIVANDIGAIRVYGGGEYLFHREPADLAASLVHAGIDWRDQEAAFHFGHQGAASWVVGLDVKRWQQNNWARQVSVKAGLEFAPLESTRNGTRYWSLLVESYRGPSPYGQFYQDDLRYWGVSIQLGL